MDILNAASLLLDLLIGPLMIAVPLLLFRWGIDAAAYSEPYGHWRVNNATIAGVIVGVCLLIATPLPGMPLSVMSLFATTSPWAMPAPDFAAMALDRMLVAPHAMIDELLDGDSRSNMAIALLVAGGLVMGRALVDTLREFDWPMTIATLMIDMFIMALTAMMLFYAAILGLWLCNRMNFWVLLVVVLLIQEYRYNVLRLFPRHRSFRLPRTVLPLGALSRMPHKPSRKR